MSIVVDSTAGPEASATLVLSRGDVTRLINRSEVTSLLRGEFQSRCVTAKPPGLRARATLHGSGTSLVVFPGLISGVPAYTVKVHAKFPQRVPAIRGVVNLHQLDTGFLLAILDSGHLTAVRTALAASLATDLLARKDARRAAIVGAGVQGEMQLREVARLRAIESVTVFDLDRRRADDFASRMTVELGRPVRAVDSAEEATGGADIVIAATWSRVPFLHPGMIAAGAHVTTLGADEPGKCEATAELLLAGRFVCDDRDLASTVGAVAAAGLGPEVIHADLGEILAGRRAGRTDASQITIFGSVGLAFQDLAVAWPVYCAAVSSGAGVRVDLGA
jgi:ornithine cyclodeaminase/alanine dehydrogenase-like protein (mu-crystallin family)